MSLEDALDDSGVVYEELACSVGVAEDVGGGVWGLEDVWEPLEVAVSVGKEGDKWTH